ncbi:MBL fold metallo-hydrolase [Halobacillus litoralis]|uniref:MBL fold metallo-hydrolase n=1 Tax=Halobacillus litoralis TaxID=45668 RepID=UPI001CD1AE95|nr:MBL fold metallo-hydrolase [Halobacillus litoralis]MCA0970179.1 MBL fold metallo-hydrolase [Halobacillus litoralis]
MQTLKDTIHRLTVPTPYAVGDVHMYLLVGDQMTLIDAGVQTKEAWDAVRTQLKELGYQPEDISQVVLTHHHPDHMGLVNYFPNVSVVAGHPKLEPWLERDERFFTRYEQFFYHMYEESGVPDKYYGLLKALRKPLKWTAEGTLTHSLTEGQRIPGHEEWMTIETPGHAQSHLSFVRQADGLMIAGDHLLHHISSNPLLEPPYEEGEPRPRPLLQYRHSMQKVLELSIREVYPGHGKAFTDVEPLILKRLKKQEERAEKVRLMFKEGPMNAFEVCQLLFPKHIEAQFGLTMSETIGQLDYLEDTKQLETFMDGKTKYYQLAGDGHE